MPQNLNTNCETFEVETDVTNTGKVEGDEVVQLYLGLKNVPYPTPILSLKGFKRIHLRQGETQTVKFVLDNKDISLITDDGRNVICPGNVQISIGGSQPKFNRQEIGTASNGTIVIEGPVVNL
jgi:beta-glucosidase